MRAQAISPVVLICVAVGCAGAQRGTDKVADNSSAIIIRKSDINSDALQAMRTRIPSMKVTTGTGPCPRIVFRGALSANQQPAPSVYVDGILMSDTCILTTLTTNDIERIEVYPYGSTPNATIRRNASGVILVFRRVE